MSYPTSGRDRAAYWSRHIGVSEKQLEPRFRIGRRILKLYENEAATLREEMASRGFDAIEDTSRVHPSLTYAWIDQTIANMVSRNPRFRITGKRKDSVAGEVPVGRIVNHWYQEIDQLHQDGRCLLDAFCYNIGIKKLGWVSDVREEDDDIVSTAETDLVSDDPEEENLFLSTGQQTRVMADHDHVDHNEKHQPLLEDPTIEDDVKDAIIRPHIQEHNDRMDAGLPDPHVDVMEESPWGLRIWPEDFRIDPLARDGLKDARWIAFRTVKPLDEVRDNPNYSRTSVNRLEAQRIKDTPSLDPRFGEDDGFGMVTVWEVWARNFKMSGRKRRNIIAVFAEQGEQGAVMLRHEDEWPYDRLRGYPATLLTFGQGSKTWLQKPVLALAGFDNIQLLMNETLDSMLGVVRKAKNVMLYDSNIFQNDEIDLAMGAPDNVAIGVPGLSDRPGAIQPMPFVQISGDKNPFTQVILGLADRAAGSPTPGSGPDGDTATEAAIDERRTSAREGKRTDAFEKFQVETAEIIWRLHTQFQPDIEIEIDPRAREFSTIDDDVARGNYRFSIDVGSSSNIQALEKKQWLDLLNLFSGLVEVSLSTGQAPPNLAKIAEQLLVRGYDVMAPEELWPAIEEAGVADPLMAQLQQQQPPNGQPPGPINRQQFAAPAGNEISQIRESAAL